MNEAEKKDAEKKDAEGERVKLQALRLNEKTSYEAYISDLEARISRTDKLAGRVPNDVILKAKQALAEGNQAQVDELFSQIEAQADPHVIAAAEAAYQRGKLAESDIEYRRALYYFIRASQWGTDNTQYLNALGLMYHTLGECDEATACFEKTLDSDLKGLGADHPSVARDWNNLGLAWCAKGRTDKAIDDFEKALPVLIDKLGAEHPNTLMTKENLKIAKQAQPQQSD